jgi:hypothetical protein
MILRPWQNAPRHNKEQAMRVNKNNQNENAAMMEALEDRQLYSVSLTPSIPIPPPSPTVSRIVVVTPTTAPPPVQPNVVISIIAVLIGL